MRRAHHRRRAHRGRAQGPRVRGAGRRDRRTGGDLLRGRPEHPAPLDRARHGAGRAGAVPRGQAGHRPAGPERLLLRLRRGPALHPGGPEGHREEDAGDPEARPALLPPRRHRRGGPRGAGRRAVQAGAHRHQGLGVHRRRCERRGGRRRADHLRQPGREDRRPVLEGPLPRSPPAHHPEHPGLQAHAQRGRLLARQREEPDAPAHLRHRVAVQGRAEGPPRLPRRGREARPPQARQRARPLLHPRRDRLRPRRLPPARRHHPPDHGGLLAQAARGGGLRVRLLPARHQGRPLREERPPGLVRGGHVPPCSSTVVPTTTSSP